MFFVRNSSHAIAPIFTFFYSPDEIFAELRRCLVVILQLAAKVVEFCSALKNLFWVDVLIKRLLNKLSQMLTVFFQILLPLVEQIVLEICHLILSVEAIRIGPLEHLPALDHCLTSL